MKLQLVARRGAVAEVLAQLQAEITGGEYKLDERLPSESELCKKFGVSRPVVREALGSLQALGFTAAQPGIGTFVVSDRVRAPLLLGRYSPANVREVRRCIEVPAIRLAAERRTDRDIGEMAAILARMEDADNPARRNQLDATFHIAIARASGNPLIVKIVEELRSVLEEHSLAAARAPYRRRAAAERSFAESDAKEAKAR